VSTVVLCCLRFADILQLGRLLAPAAAMEATSQANGRLSGSEHVAYHSSGFILTCGSGETTGWTGLIRVDNTTYTWLGNPNPLPQVATQTSFGYTSTRSIYTFDVGGMIELTVTFLSPVTPDDMLRQSAPISYMLPVVQSKDGKEHDVKIYTDVSAGMLTLGITIGGIANVSRRMVLRRSFPDRAVVIRHNWWK